MSPRNKENIHHSSFQNNEDSPLLREICSRSDGLRVYFKPGLGAIQNRDRGKIKVPYTSLLSGSVNLDEAAKPSHPNANRWDYAIEYAGKIFFIEIHPANTSEIDTVIRKVVFVKGWLAAIAPEMLRLPGPGKFYWVSSGTTDLRINPNSAQARKLALHKIVTTGKSWDYTKISK